MLCIIKDATSISNLCNHFTLFSFHSYSFWTILTLSYSFFLSLLHGITLVFYLLIKFNRNVSSQKLGNPWNKPINWLIADHTIAMNMRCLRFIKFYMIFLIGAELVKHVQLCIEWDVSILEPWTVCRHLYTAKSVMSKAHWTLAGSCVLSKESLMTSKRPASQWVGLCFLLFSGSVDFCRKLKKSDYCQSVDNQSQLLYWHENINRFKNCLKTGIL